MERRVLQNHKVHVINITTLLVAGNPPQTSLLNNIRYHKKTQPINMYTSTISALAVLLVVRLALADFKVFCGMDMNSGDGITAADCMFFNNPPDCDDVIGGSVPFYIERDNDASGGGLACDGCSSAVAVQDWDVTRLEINEPDYFDNGADHFST